MTQSIRSNRRDRGASVIEFALVAPFLITLILGVVEFSWVLAQNLDVRQGAREGARITAVDTSGNNVNLGAEICSRMDLTGGQATVTWTADPTDFGDSSTLEVGDGVTVDVIMPLTTLTGFLDWAFPISQLDSSVEIRIEQTPTWADGSYSCATGVFA